MHHTPGEDKQLPAEQDEETVVRGSAASKAPVLDRLVEGGEDGYSDGFDSWEAMQCLSEGNRQNIMADIVGHPTLITVEELEHMNPSLSADTIRYHLQELLDVGLVAEYEAEQRKRDFPYKFYGVTSDARMLFDKNNWFPEAAWERQYKAVEKTPRIELVESMPRPSKTT